VLDAHPEIIISNFSPRNTIDRWHHYKSESKGKDDSLKLRLFFDIHSMSRFHAMCGKRASSWSCVSENHKYCYNVPGQWQGTYRDKLKVIGDQAGTSTSKLLTNPQNVKVLEDIQRTLQTKLKFIHVIRNPFDNIATKLLRSNKLHGSKVAWDANFKANDSSLLDEIIAKHFRQAESAQRLLQYGKFEVLNIYSHEVVSNPEDNLQKLCNFMEVSCDKDYIDASSKLFYSSSHLTRNFVVWSSKQKQRVVKEMEKYPFLRSFSFDSS